MVIGNASLVFNNAMNAFENITNDYFWKKNLIELRMLLSSLRNSFDVVLGAQNAFSNFYSLET